MKRYVLTALTLLILTAGGVALAQHAGHGAKPMDEKSMQKMMRDMMPGPKDSASTRAFKEAHMKMMQDMHIAYTGNTDVDFARGMIAHHQGAIEMAKVQLQYGKDPEFQKLSRDIIAAQEKEIAQMQDWLKKNQK